MAKRGVKREKSAQRSAEAAIGDFAEDLGRLLGTAQAKAQGWIGQRATITKSLQEIRDTASALLSELVGGAARGARQASAAARNAGKGRKKRRLSPEARNRIAEAQRKRWAAFRAAKRK